MLALATSTICFTVVDTGFNVIGPLWATRDLGLGNAGWAFLRAAAESGGLLSAVGLGMLSERIGARRMSALSLVLAAAALIGLATGVATPWMMVVYGAFITVVYVSFNTLAQQVSTSRASVANSIYRAAAALAAIAAPVVATRAGDAFGAYLPVLAGAACVLLLAAVFIAAYPQAQSLRSPRSFQSLLSDYRRAFTLRPLLAFICITRGFGAALAAVSAFGALRLTRELHMGEPDFGTLRSVAAVVSLTIVLAGGWIVDRLRPSRMMAFAWFGCGMSSLVIGLSNSLSVTAAAYACCVALLASCSVPISLWASHIADGEGPDGPGHTAVFTVAKVFQTAITMATMLVLGVLEPWVGMRHLLWGGGLLALPLALAIARLGAAQKV